MLSPSLCPLTGRKTEDCLPTHHWELDNVDSPQDHNDPDIPVVNLVQCPPAGAIPHLAQGAVGLSSQFLEYIPVWKKEAGNEELVLIRSMADGGSTVSLIDLDAALMLGATKIPVKNNLSILTVHGISRIKYQFIININFQGVKHSVRLYGLPSMAREYPEYDFKEIPEVFEKRFGVYAGDLFQAAGEVQIIWEQTARWPTLKFCVRREK